MSPAPSTLVRSWPAVTPVLALAALVAAWGRDIGPVVVTLVALVLVGAVLAAVHHAEVIAHRVGEPFGSLVLAVAVTVIEVALIVTLMVSGGDKSGHAGAGHRLRRGDDHDERRGGPLAAGRGAASRRTPLQRRGSRLRAGHPGGARDAEPGAADVHHERPGPQFSPAQLVFAGGLPRWACG